MKVLADCYVEAWLWDDSVGSVSGCRPVGARPLPGRTWDDLQQVFTREGLDPSLGFAAGEAREALEASFAELGSSGETRYEAFLFRSRADAVEAARPASRVARVVFGDAGMEAGGRGTVRRLGRIVVWYRRGEPELAHRLSSVLARAASAGIL